MSQQLICDDCGEPIDTSEAYYSLSGSKVKVVDGALTVVDQAVTLDYHEEHLPAYKVLGEPVVIPPSTTPPEGDEVPTTPETPPEVIPSSPPEGDEVPAT